MTQKSKKCLYCCHDLHEGNLCKQNDQLGTGHECGCNYEASKKILGVRKFEKFLREQNERCFNPVVDHAMNTPVECVDCGYKWITRAMMSDPICPLCGSLEILYLEDERRQWVSFT